MSGFRAWSFVLVLVLAAVGAPVAGSVGQPATIQDRARGSERIVVATVTEVTASMQRNEYGDELIFSHAQLAIEEAIKGGAEAATVSIEGGTLNGITLRVSNLPTLRRGERAVFFLNRGRSGEFKPYLAGQGILKLDAANNVQGSSLTLEDVRRMARSEAR